MSSHFFLISLLQTLFYRQVCTVASRIISEFDNVLAVGAINSQNIIAYFSNAGPEVNVVALGVNIRSTVPNNVAELTQF